MVLIKKETQEDNAFSIISNFLDLFFLVNLFHPSLPHYRKKKEWNVLKLASYLQNEMIWYKSIFIFRVLNELIHQSNLQDNESKMQAKKLNDLYKPQIELNVSVLRRSSLCLVLATTHLSLVTGFWGLAEVF